MRKPLTIACVSAALLSACGEPSGPEEVAIRTERLPVELTSADLYNVPLVMAFLENKEKSVDEANRLFMKGVDAYRNNKNLDSAFRYFQSSILKEPSAKAYFELGNVQMDQKQFKEALDAYTLAERLDYQPFSKILYNKACLYSLSGEIETAGKYLEFALQAGYNNMDHINTDEDLAALRGSSSYFESSLKQGIRGMSNADNMFWLQFKKLFPKYTLPHTTVVTTDVTVTEGLRYISYDFEKYISEMRDEKFSREVSKGFYHYGQFHETDKYVALIYVVRDEFMGEYAPPLYRLVTFTHDGELIDKKDIGGREYLEDDIMIATLNPDRSIDIDLMSPTYEKDPEDKGYWENAIIKLTKVGHLTYQIDGDGMIVESKKYKNDISFAE